MTAALSDHNPYKGQLSFEVEDASLFFGREKEAAQLTTRILANRMTVLHAASGAGKTSLLNARIIPALEGQGWLPIRSKPDFRPVDEIRRDTLHTLFPPMEAELLALEETLRELGLENEPGVTLGDVLAWFDKAALPSERQRRLLAPVGNETDEWIEVHGRNSRAVPFQSAEGVMPAFQQATPYFVRLLRRTIDTTMLEAHLATVLDAGIGADWGEGVIREDMPTATLREVLSDAGLVAAYRALVSSLHASPAGLRPFFENLMQSYGAGLGPCGLVLVLDQFEQIFTLFSGRPRQSPSSAPSVETERWRLRDELFDELERLYRSAPAGSDQSAATELPIRYVISLRDEWVGRLNRFRAFVSDFDSTIYRLNWLTADAARDAIDGPAKRAGREVAWDCREAIITARVTEDDLVEPGPLQLVCRGLWEHHLKSGEGVVITTRSIGERGVNGILLETFEQFFSGLSSFEKVELLDILAPLLTFNRTRNIVERRRLTDVEFRDPKVRGRLLDVLEHRRIVRREPRGSEVFYEITHEFLIDPILDELRTNAEYEGISRALLALRSRLDGTVSEPLPDYTFAELEKQKRHVCWPAAATEVMLANAVVLGASRETIRDWAGRYAETAVSIDTVMSAEGLNGSRLLSRPELEQLRLRPDLLKTPHQAASVARSLIRRAPRLDRAEFRQAVEVMRRVHA